jgi:hypothetical protein
MAVLKKLQNLKIVMQSSVKCMWCLRDSCISNHARSLTWYAFNGLIN